MFNALIAAVTAAMQKELQVFHAQKVSGKFYQRFTRKSKRFKRNKRRGL